MVYPVSGLPVYTGKVLTGYTINRLSDASKKELLRPLARRAGGTPAEDSFTRIAQAVREFDEHLTVGRSINRDGKVSVTIMAPGAPRDMSMSNVPTLPPPTGDTKRITIGGN